MKRVTYILMGLFYCSVIQAQSLRLDGVTAMNDPLPLYLANLQVYVDEINKENAEQASAKTFQSFSHYFPTVPDHLPPDKTWWLKLEIESRYANDTTVVFYPGFQNYVHIYLADSGRYTPVAHCGNMLPASQLSIPDFRQAAILPLPANKKNFFYISVYNRTTYHTDPLKPYLMSKASLDDIQLKSLQRNRQSDFIYIVGLGMFLIMIVYLLIKWAYIKDPAYFYYALSLIGGMVFYLTNFVETGNNILFLKEKPYLIYMLSDVFAFLSAYGYWQFVRKFLYIDRGKPKLGKYMKMVSWFILAFMIVSHVLVFATGSITMYIKMNTIAGILFILLGIVVLFGIRNLNQPLRRIIYGGIFITILFYSFASLFEILRGTRYEIFSWLEGSAPIMMLGNIIQMLFFTIGLAYRNKLESVEAVEFKVQKSEAEMKALRAQMNPHFIFNCMHTIDAYIFKEQPDKASAFLNKFSKLIRQTLENSEMQLIPLSKEIESLMIYTELEQERYDFSFQTIYTINNNTRDYKVPPLLLQPYAENAILHGLRHLKSRSGILQIETTEQEENLCIRITDNGIGRKAAAEINKTRTTEHTSMAVDLTRQRLRFNYDNKMVEGKVEVNDLFIHNETGTEVIITLLKIIK